MWENVGLPWGIWDFQGKILGFPNENFRFPREILGFPIEILEIWGFHKQFGFSNKKCGRIWGFQ